LDSREFYVIFFLFFLHLRNDPKYKKTTDTKFVDLFRNMLPYIFHLRRSQRFVSCEAKIFRENSTLFTVFLKETLTEVAQFIKISLHAKVKRFLFNGARDVLPHKFGSSSCCYFGIISNRPRWTWKKRWRKLHNSLRSLSTQKFRGLYLMVSGMFHHINSEVHHVATLES
jgi:hypothetical protein